MHGVSLRRLEATETRERNPLEPPSRQLQQVLLSKKLCSARELRRCASRVRRLASDLPGFDSVWLDALVQRRVLTSFQARSIEAQEYDRLTIGPSIVLDQIGHGPDSETYLTKLPHERATCIVKRVSVATELRGPTLKRLQRLTERGRQCQHLGVVIPHASRELPPADHGRSGRRAGSAARLTTQTRLAIVSRPAEGLTLSQMLLRRGRFSESVVQEVARQLLDATAALHECKIVHGEIRLDNLLLSSSGQLVMVDCGVRPAIRPAFEISAFVGPERNEGIAPELIGTGDPTSPASDLYAIGCILWQLLAGRSAHPTGDPLAKLAAHQTERVPDVRDLAPETSERLAEVICWLTSPNPKDRPANARDVLATPSSQKSDTKQPTLGAAGRRSRTVLARFAGQFQHPVARSSDPTRRPRTGRRLMVATAAMLIAVGALHVFSGRDALPASIDRFGTWLQTQYAALTEDSEENSAAADSAGPNNTGSESYSPFPEPAADGTITFPHAGPWKAESIAWPGARLRLTGPTDEPARIVIDDDSWRLRAVELQLENLEVELPASALHGIEIQSQTLTLRHCAVRSPIGSSSAIQAANVPAVHWQPLDAQDPLAGQVRFSNSQFIGSQSTVHITSPTRVLSCRNVLKVSGGPLFVIGPDAQPVSRTIDLHQVTVRNASTVIAVQLDSSTPAGRSRLELRTNNCVFTVTDWQSQPGSLITYVGGQLSHDWDRFLSVAGDGSVAAPGTRVVSRQSLDGQQRFLLDESGVSLRGIVSAGIEFRGPESQEPTASVVSRIAANRRSSDLPGYRVP